MALAMTDGEICEMYRTAKDQKKQLGILAEMNNTDKGTIAAILREGGYKIDGRWLNDRRPRAEEPPAGKSAADPPPHAEETGSVPQPVTAGELYQALGSLPADALVLIGGRPFEALCFTRRMLPEGWRETVDLIGRAAHE